MPKARKPIRLLSPDGRYIVAFFPSNREGDVVSVRAYRSSSQVMYPSNPLRLALTEDEMKQFKFHSPECELKIGGSICTAVNYHFVRDFGRVVWERLIDEQYHVIVEPPQKAKGDWLWVCEVLTADKDDHNLFAVTRLGVFDSVMEINLHFLTEISDKLNPSQTSVKQRLFPMPNTEDGRPQRLSVTAMRPNGVVARITC